MVTYTGLVRSRLRLLTLTFAVAISLAASGRAEAQLLYGSIVGTVVDAQAATVPGARVTIVNKDTNFSRESTTDAQGGYSFTNVQAGPYDVKVTLQGFKEAIQSRVPVTVGQISRVDLTLTLGALTETVTVQSAAELLQTDKADVHTELRSTEITNLPLNQFRNYPGVGSPRAWLDASNASECRNRYAGTVAECSGQWTGRGGQYRRCTDGTRRTSTWGCRITISTYRRQRPSSRSISRPAAWMPKKEWPRAPRITVITKSGTNTFRGSAFEFFNNEKLNAKPD